MALKFSGDIRGPQGINPDDFGDPQIILHLVPPADWYFQFRVKCLVTVGLTAMEIWERYLRSPVCDLLYLLSLRNNNYNFPSHWFRPAKLMMPAWLEVSGRVPVYWIKHHIYCQAFLCDSLKSQFKSSSMDHHIPISGNSPTMQWVTDMSWMQRYQPCQLYTSQ